MNAKNTGNNAVKGKELKFKVKFPDSRPGNTTPDGGEGWTYHHVLPWRYYYLCAYVLCMVFRYMVIHENGLYRSQNKTRGTGPSTKALAQSFWDEKKGAVDQTSVRKVYGDDSIGFDFSGEIKAAEVWSLIATMVTSKNHALDEPVGSSSPIDPDVVARACLGPAFGGFWGINGGQRYDDPKELREPRAPNSAGENWWNRLGEVATALQAFCSAIAQNLPANRELEVVVKKDSWKILYSALQSIQISKYAAPSFDREDWIYRMNGSAYEVVLNGIAKESRTVKKTGEVFALRKAEVLMEMPTNLPAPDFVRIDDGAKKDCIAFRNAR